MDIKRIIRKEFSFLQHIGFRVKAYSINGDLELCFSDKKNTVEVLYTLGIKERGMVFFDDNLLNKCEYTIDAIVTYEEERQNILDSNLFSETEKDSLKREAMSVSDELEKIVLYAQYIKQKIPLLC